MASITLPAAEPVSSGEMQAIDPQRSDEVDFKHQRISEFLSETGFDGLLIQDPTNFAWFTCGGENTRRGGDDRIAALFITSEARVVICQNVDSGQLFDRELPGLGFQLKERPWQENKSVLISDLCRGRNVASDTGHEGTTNVAERLTRLRLPLTEFEQGAIRELAHAVAHAVEATARTFEHRQNEAEIAGQLAHRLIQHEIVPVVIQVLADGQGHRYRHWSYGADRVERSCVISATGRKRGLHASCTRTVTFDNPPKSLADAHHVAGLVQATGIYFSHAGWELGETWSRVQRIYEKFGAGDEWRLAELAELCGYSAQEHLLKPTDPHVLSPGTPIFWHPSVRTALTGDTILVHDGGTELLTSAGAWPKLNIHVKGTEVEVPAVLRRHEKTEWAI